MRWRIDCRTNRARIFIIVSDVRRFFLSMKDEVILECHISYIGTDEVIDDSNSPL